TAAVPSCSRAASARAISAVAPSSCSRARRRTGPRIITRTTGSRATVAHGSARLWGRAGIRPADVDVAMLYDHFTPMVLLALEARGFCAPGEGGPFVENGAIRWPDGRLP